MPTLLKTLALETKEALGGLAKQYDTLLEKGKSESLRDDKDAVKYADDVIRRYKTIKASSPSQEALQVKREKYLPELKLHAAEITLLSFSKPGDVASRLQELDFEPDAIAQITKGMEQAGGDDDLAILLSSLVTSETSLALCNGSHHHHHHSTHTHGHF